jgi:hypothetical protein
MRDPGQATSDGIFEAVWEKICDCAEIAKLILKNYKAFKNICWLCTSHSTGIYMFDIQGNMLTQLMYWSLSKNYPTSKSCPLKKLAPSKNCPPSAFGGSTFILDYHPRSLSSIIILDHHPRSSSSIIILDHLQLNGVERR